jgi:hypothetical protein
MIREKPAPVYQQQNQQQEPKTLVKTEKKTSKKANEEKEPSEKLEAPDEKPEMKTTNNSGDFQLVVESWDGILNEIKKLRVSFHAVIKEAEPYELKGNTLKFVFQPNYKFHYDQATKKENLDFFKAFINKKLNTNYNVEFSFNDGKKKVENEEDSIDIIKEAEEFFGQKVEKIND